MISGDLLSIPQQLVATTRTVIAAGLPFGTT